MARRAMLVLTEAETCATAGNMMYARWHLSEILRNLPNSAADIAGYCVNEKLRLLADEFGAVEEFRPRFTADAAAAYEAKDLNRLAEILKSCPPPLLSLGRDNPNTSGLTLHLVQSFITSPAPEGER
jgi:hypothetical protein